MSSNCVQPWRAALARGIPRPILSSSSRRATIPLVESKSHCDQCFLHKLVRRLTVMMASLLESALRIFPPPLLIAKASRFLPCISHPLHTRCKVPILAARAIHTSPPRSATSATIPRLGPFGSIPHCRLHTTSTSSSTRHCIRLRPSVLYLYHVDCVCGLSLMYIRLDSLRLEENHPRLCSRKLLSDKLA